MIGSAAQHLRDDGVQGGEPVGLYMQNTLLHLLAFFGALAAGAWTVPMQPWLSPDTRARLLARYGIRRVISEKAGSDFSGAVVVHFATVEVHPGAHPLPVHEPAPDDPCCVVLTSGTTAEPKGVRYRHAELLERGIRSMPGCGANTRLLPPNLHLSVGHMYPARVLAAGGALVFPHSESWPDMADALRRHHVTHLLQSPLAAEGLLTQFPQPGTGLPDLQHLRLVGGAAPPPLLEALRQRVTPQVWASYGLTELGVVALAAPDPLAADPKSAGRLCVGTRAEIIDESGRVLPAGERGELRVRAATGPHAYFPEEPRTEGRFRDGWCHTGDLASLSADGELFIEGRLDDLINLGGHKLLPGHAEQVLRRHEGVRDAAVFALERPGRINALGALLVSAEGQLPAGLPGRCARELGLFAPSEYFLAQALPRNAMGKLQRKQLPALAAAIAAAAAPG